MVCPFVGIRRFCRWFGRLTRGPARDLSLCRPFGRSGPIPREMVWPFVVWKYPARPQRGPREQPGAEHRDAPGNHPPTSRRPEGARESPHAGRHPTRWRDHFAIPHTPRVPNGTQKVCPFVVSLKGRERTQKVCPFVWIRRFCRWFDGLTRGPARGLSHCRLEIPRASPTGHKRSVLLSDPAFLSLVR